jgi:two-component system, cell cycle sensor histidine kinase and response regulator CckA
MSEPHQGREGEAAALRAPKAGESILVVEDHPALRELIRTFLADDGGYPVRAVGTSGEAEAAWAGENGGFDLLITDLVMPGKSGRALAEDLVARKGSLKTLFISGHSQDHGSERKVTGPFLQKPFTRQELLKMVRAIFAGDPPGPFSDPGKHY